eukprot:363566-Chlamydomonas_euryale.AAC.8
MSARMGERVLRAVAMAASHKQALGLGRHRWLTACTAYGWQENARCAGCCVSGAAGNCVGDQRQHQPADRLCVAACAARGGDGAHYCIGGARRWFGGGRSRASMRTATGPHLRKCGHTTCAPTCTSSCAPRPSQSHSLLPSKLPCTPRAPAPPPAAPPRTRPSESTYAAARLPARAAPAALPGRSDHSARSASLPGALSRSRSSHGRVAVLLLADDVLAQRQACADRVRAQCGGRRRDVAGHLCDRWGGDRD